MLTSGRYLFGIMRALRVPGQISATNEKASGSASLALEQKHGASSRSLESAARPSDHSCFPGTLVLKPKFINIFLVFVKIQLCFFGFCSRIY